MRLKVEYLVLIGIIAALAIYLSLRSNDRTQYELPEIPEVAAKDITRIEITRQKSTIELVKKDESWLIQPQGYPADPSRMEAILATICTLKVTALASEAKDYQRYELDDGRGIQVKAFAGGSLAREFEIGKTAPSFRHTFVRLGDDPRVFHARENFRNKFDLEAAALQDKKVLQLDMAALVSFGIQTQAGVVEFIRAAAAGDETQAGKPASAWQRSDGQIADQAAVEKLLGSVAHLKCRRFIDGQTKESLGNPIFTLTLNDGGSHTLSIFAQQEADADSYPATSSASPFAFYLTAGQAEQIMQPPEDLMPQEQGGKKDSKS